MMDNESEFNKHEKIDGIALYKKASEAIARMFKSEYIDLSIADMLNLVEDKTRREKLLAMHKDFEEGFSSTPCSIKYHSPYAGGLGKHTQVVMQTALVLWDWLGQYATHHYTDYIMVEYDKDKFKRESVDKNVAFTKDALISVAYLHDIGKIASYEMNQDGTFRKNSMIQTHDIHRTLHYAGLYGIRLSHLEMNAILFHGGGWTKTDYYLQPQKLAYYVHISDLIASQIMEI